MLSMQDLRLRYVDLALRRSCANGVSLPGDNCLTVSFSFLFSFFHFLVARPVQHGVLVITQLWASLYESQLTLIQVNQDFCIKV